MMISINWQSFSNLHEAQALVIGIIRRALIHFSQPEANLWPNKSNIRDWYKNYKKEDSLITVYFPIMKVTTYSNHSSCRVWRGQLGTISLIWWDGRTPHDRCSRSTLGRPACLDLNLTKTRLSWAQADSKSFEDSGLIAAFPTVSIVCRSTV